MTSARPATPDQNDYVVLPGVAVLDEFHLTRPGIDEVIDPQFLQDVCSNGNRRETETGDLCPVVLGHINLKPGTPEVDQPKVVGFARNWRVAPLFDTGRLAAVVDFWIKKLYYHMIQDYPSRSPELWATRREIHPISLLGATAPHRDLGPLPVALNRNPGSDESPVSLHRDLGPLPVHLNHSPEPDMPMPTDDKDTKKKDDPADKGEKKTPEKADTTDLLSQLVAAVSALSSKIDQMAGGAGVPNPAAGAATDPNAGAAGGTEGDISDEELMRLLGGDEGAGAAGTGGAPDRAEEKPVQNMGYAGPTNTSVPDQTQMSRQIGDLMTQLARRDIADAFKELKAKGVVIPDEQDETDDLLAMPPERRVAKLARWAKMPAAPVGLGINPAVRDALVGTGGTPGKDRGTTKEESEKVAQLARTENISYEVAHFKTFGAYPYGHSQVESQVSRW